jgi:hypothetical protein
LVNDWFGDDYDAMTLWLSRSYIPDYK